MYQLLPGPDTIHWGYFDGSLPPVAEIDSGDFIRLRSVSGDPAEEVPPEWLPPEIPEIFAKVKQRGPGSHILTGPVYVRGARPGSVLQVEIHAIELGAPYGNNKLIPLKGMFPDDIDHFERHIIPIDRATGNAEVLPGVTFPTRPFFGVMGVAPPLAWGRIDSSQPRRHGGNMDNKELVAGTCLFLPVFVDGALFSAGDGHAAQGDGEITINAIETCLEGEFRLQVRDDMELTLPLAVTPTHLITMGFHEDLDEAARIAVRSLLTFLKEYCGTSWKDAYRLASMTADLRVTQVVNGNKGVHVMFDRGLLDQLGCRFVFPC